MLWRIRKCSRHFPPVGVFWSRRCKIPRPKRLLNMGAFVACLLGKISYFGDRSAEVLPWSGIWSNFFTFTSFLTTFYARMRSHFIRLSANPTRLCLAITSRCLETNITMIRWRIYSLFSNTICKLSGAKVCSLADGRDSGLCLGTQDQYRREDDRGCCRGWR